MLDLKSFTQAIQQIADEKGIPEERIVEAIEMALAAAYKRDYGKRGQIVRATLNPKTGGVALTQIKIVVDPSMVKSEEELALEDEAGLPLSGGAVEATEERPSPASRREEEKEEAEGEATLPEAEKKVRFNPEKHLMLEEARATKPDAEPGEELEFPLEYREEFGRIAAQTAKQVILQRIREVEREVVYNAYKDREGEVVSGLVQRLEGRNVFVDMGRSAGILPPEEQIPYERYSVGKRLKVLITLVEKSPKGSGVFLSRSHPRLLRKLFEIEVPEIASGAVEIKAIAREPGSRSKVAVVSHESGVDPVGSLVGQKGVRVNTVISELGGEKIDVIEWSEEPLQFIANALSPAKVVEVRVDERRHDASVFVPEDQLSLAIGKGGQNVRLAARLTGWKIDVRAYGAPSPAGDEAAGAEEPSAEPVPETEATKANNE